jgi:hypothetical protein
LGQEQGAEGIMPFEVVTFDRALDARRDEWLAQPRILGDAFGSAVGEVHA